eukprot:SAG31_NODE_6826_length_1876_cov_6.082724_2_plen_93_part_00
MSCMGSRIKMFFEKHSAALEKRNQKYHYRVPRYLNEQIGPQSTGYLRTTTKVLVPPTQVPKRSRLVPNELILGWGQKYWYRLLKIADWTPER